MTPSMNPDDPLRATADDDALMTVLSDELVAVEEQASAALQAAMGPGLPMVGDVLDDAYRVTGLLGRGGMGVVLLADDVALARPVAVKLMNAAMLQSTDAKERFVTEARAMAGVRHENVVQIYRLGSFDDAPFFAMEYVPGETVVDWLERKWDQGGPPPAVDEALGILDQLCRGLGAIHDAGIVHADVKPGNVLLGPAFRAAVADFGLHRPLGHRDSGEMVVGTPAYLPPEVVTSRAPVFGSAADVYAVGVMAYEMLTGDLPFPIESVGDLFEVHLRGRDAPAASKLRGDLPPAFDAVLSRALARDPKDRYGTMDALRKALLTAREDSGARATETRRIVVADDDADFRALAEETLRFAFPGAEVVGVGDGEGALDALDAARSALAVVDLDMPGMNGVELTAAIRGRDGLEGLPVVVVTATGGAPDWRLLQLLGADGFLVKPIDPYALMSIARRLVGAAP
ncbi:MAG: protein kinase [Myxococcota bacterium]